MILNHKSSLMRESAVQTISRK